MTSLAAGLSKHGRDWRQCVAALLAISAVQVGAAELRVTTEYVYPTKYTGVMPPSGAAVGVGAVSVNQPLVAIPGDFAVRETGVLFGPGVTLSHLNSEAAVVSLLEQRNKNGNTELMVAAALGDGEQVRRLLARGAMVNARNNFGSTALMGAAAGGFTDIVEMLLARGALPNGKSSSGSTALMFACRNGQLEVARQLIGKGAAVNDASRDGYSPLMFAISSGSEEVVRLLLSMGARKDVQDRHGTTPIALASAKKSEAIVVLLTRAPASK